MRWYLQGLSMSADEKLLWKGSSHSGFIPLKLFHVFNRNKKLIVGGEEENLFEFIRRNEKYKNSTHKVQCWFLYLPNALEAIDTIHFVHFYDDIEKYDWLDDFAKHFHCNLFFLSRTRVSTILTQIRSKIMFPCSLHVENTYERKKKFKWIRIIFHIFFSPTELWQIRA